MSSAVRWLRTSYRIGAIADAAVAILLLNPKAYAWGMGLTGFAPGNDYRHAMGVAAALMAGWTALLLWADRRPLERRGVLVITVAVIAGLAANELWSVIAGFLSPGRVAPIWLLQAGLATLFLGSHAAAGRAASRDRKASDVRRGP